VQVERFKTKKAPLALTEEEDTAAAEPAAATQLEEAPQEAKVETPKPKSEPQLAQIPSAGAMNLRWPLKGKVISNFGPKNNGLKNEGINIAVPEGTSIRAAEGGVVAYAGNELKGYGNLVLIRHQGGYVTAYAHAKEIMVKRGDTVKRGDIIAKAGQTGAVSSPQLHFEVRKGATALDPMKHLSSATAMN
jgi:murein DD-endopeptidase MepM/ murein hydrolase activator NlpD